MANAGNGEQVQVLLGPEELAAVDEFQRKRKLSSRSAAIREILRMSLGIPAKERARAAAAAAVRQRLPMTKPMTRPWHRAKRAPNSA